MAAARASFELIDAAGGLAPGPWRARPAGPASFGAGGEDAPAGPVWLVDLPADRAAAAAALALAEADLRRHEAAVDGAPARIAALATGGGAASFGAGGLAAPERELLAMLDELRAGPAGEPGASFGAGAGTGWAEAAGRLRAFIAQARETAGSYAVVETRVAGVLAARTSVGLAGDMRSLVGRAALGETAALHRSSLALALRSRAALLKTCGTALRGAAIVATMVGSPAGAVLALPAAWRFVERLLEDLRGE
ncbi:MAG TPA: hypothetical protein PKD53_24805 [Chloroflexaceae bacterium]|nr:hypothetical protein [Chloroflexaceae bacterium]